MLDHAGRITTARAAIDYITSRSEADQARPVPNCPGWTVYNAASHIGRVAIAWEEMITSPPEDPESRTRGYARSAEQPEGAPLADLAAWSHAAIDHLVDDLDRRCYFSMTGGEGTAALWAWHAASELGVHRLDVEAALGEGHAQTDAEALDAVTYTAQFFLPAMRRVTENDPGGVTARLVGPDGLVGTVTIESEADASVTIEGPPTQVLLALWGRPHTGVEVVDGDGSVLDNWRALPGEAFQFGTWD